MNALDLFLFLVMLGLVLLGLVLGLVLGLMEQCLGQ